MTPITGDPPGKSARFSRIHTHKKNLEHPSGWCQPEKINGQKASPFKTTLLKKNQKQHQDGLA